MPNLLSTVDLAVLPSYREGLPRSLIEAVSAGLPIVATDVPGCREIVQHGINGFLVPVRDAKALAEAILYMINNPDIAREMGKVGRELVLTEFDEKIVFAKTYVVYKELL